MVPIGDQCGTAEPSPTSEPDARGDLIADEADDAGAGENREMVQVLRMDQAQNRLDERDRRRDSDREHNEEAGDLLSASAAQEEGDPQRYRGQCVAEVVNHVREQRNRAGTDKDKQLRNRGSPKNSERDRNRLHTFMRAEDRAIDQPVRVAMTLVLVIVVMRVVV